MIVSKSTIAGDRVSGAQKTLMRVALPLCIIANSFSVAMCKGAVLARRRGNQYCCKFLDMIQAEDHDHVIDLLSEYVDADEEEWMECSMLITAVRQRASLDSKSRLKYRWVALYVSA